MSQFRQAIHELIGKVKSSTKTDCRIVQNLDIPSGFSMLDWLQAQPLFPKFYWQSRNTLEEVVALGKVHTFSDPEPAYAILNDDQRIWGGKAFDSGCQEMPSYFFLPQVELIREESRWFLSVNVAKDINTVIEALSELVSDIPVLEPVSTNIESVTHSPELPEWTAMLEKALSEIENGQFKKVVPARKTDVVVDSAVSAARLLKASREKNHNSFHFLMALNSESAFIGSTPERLYSRNGKELETEAVAGTTGRGSDAQKDQELANWLTHDAKNLQENMYVVDDIVERLTPLARKIDAQKEAYSITLRKVQHLKRNIHALLNPDINGVQLLSALQPTAAVAGLPRDAAKAFIHENEPFSRGWYSGSLGFVSHKKAEFCVALRSAFIKGKQITLYAGAGVLPGSNADYEWQELDRKMSTLFTLLTEKNSAGASL